MNNPEITTPKMKYHEFNPEKIKIEKLTNLIKENNLIIIQGQIGSGPRLLLNKLARHPDLKGQVYRSHFSLSNLDQGKNIFIDIPNLFTPNPQEKKEWEELLALRRYNKQRIFLNTYHRSSNDLDNIARQLADLTITTQGIISDDKKHLRLKIEKGDETWTEKIEVTEQDFSYPEPTNIK